MAYILLILKDESADVTKVYRISWKSKIYSFNSFKIIEIEVHLERSNMDTNLSIFEIFT